MSGRTGWQKIARRIRVPMGFVFAALFLWLADPGWRTIALSVALVLPGLWLRGYASGYVRKDAQLTTTGPLCTHAKPSLSGIDADCIRVCGGVGELDESGAADGAVRGDIYSDDFE